MSALAPTRLEGAHVVLERLEARHEPELLALPGDPDIWRYHTLDVGPFEHFMRRWIDQSLATTNEVVFVVRRTSDARLVGSTRFLSIVLEHRRIEIGGTWYVQDARATNVNPSCKLLLMTHAFETLGVGRLELKCDLRNERSRRAIRALGAVEEGVLRKHIVYESGYVRDTNYFSVLRDEWPAVKARLEARLA